MPRILVPCNFIGMKEEIAERIRMARLSRGLSQENVAVELKLTTAAYSNIERGVTDITVSRLAQIAGILDKSIAELMGFTQPNIHDGPLIYKQQFGQQIMMLSQQTALLQQRIEVLEKHVAVLKDH